MNTLTTAIVAVVLAAAATAFFQPGNTAGVLLTLGAPFALFANVMATEAPPLGDAGGDVAAVTRLAAVESGA